jgi:rhamnosyl/mannosyltransferase
MFRVVKSHSFPHTARYLKILHVGKYFSPFSGGLENYMRDAMVALARRGIASIALVHRHSLSLRTRDETFRTGDHKFHVIRTGMWARFLYTSISPMFPWHLRRIIKLYRPDILHLHLPNPSAFWALLLPSARSLPWVVHWHADVITAAQSALMKMVYSVYKPFERAVLKRARAIVVTSLPYRDSSKPLQQWLEKSHVVPLGVDTERFASTNLASGVPVGAAPRRDSPDLAQNRNDRDGAPLLQVLAVGRLTYYKGFQNLIEAAGLVPEVQVSLVGVGEQAKQLKTLVTSLKLQDRVTFHGVLSDPELAQLMANCDCLCLPSIERTEAFGMVLLEAMYFGKATVVGNVKGAGMGWVIDDGLTGIKVKPADSQSLAEALAHLAKNRKELVRMGQQGKKRFDEHFEINRAVQGLVDIYTQIMNQTEVQPDGS